MKIKLGQALEYEQPTKYIVASEKYKDEYETPVLTAGKSFILGYTNETDGIYTNLPVIIFDDFTTDVKFVDFPFKVKSSAMKMLQPSSEEYNLKFFYYLIKFMNFQPTSHQRHWISKFAEFEFDIPAKEKQDEIVEKLDKLCEMLALKDKELKKYDDLVKSQFIEMFGDRLTNTKQWQEKDLKDCVDFYNGKAHEQVVDKNGQYILVTSRCIASDMIDYRKTNALLFPLQKNDITMVMSDVPNGKAFAKCMLIDEDNKFTLNQRICCLRNYEFNPIYLLHLLNRHEYFLKFDDGNSQTNLRKNDLLGCNIIIPPIELQNQFADFVKHIDKLKFTIKESIEKLNLCYQSLMKEYFE